MNQNRPPTYIHVALPVPLYKAFDYLAPPNSPLPDIGARVVVPFGSRELVGVVIAHSDHCDTAQDKLKTLIKTCDNTPCLPTELLTLLHWASTYYHHPLGETLATALPPKLRKGDKPITLTGYRHTKEGLGLGPRALARAPKQQAVHQHLLQHQTLLQDDLTNLQISRATIKALLNKHIIAEVDLDDRPTIATNRVATPQQILAEPPLTLNTEQEAAVNQIAFHHFNCNLLEGTTGSGKTEVYMQLIGKALERGTQALILIPEIGLSPQTVKRFKQRFAVPIAELHSNISEAKRTRSWQQAKNGQARIIIGTRLASLCPVKALGIIIVDEEHDNSYKQQDGLKYSARDISIYRAKQHQIPIILGTATPSLESLNNAIQQRFQHLVLRQRAGTAKPPTLEIVDVRDQALFGGLSATAINALQACLERNEQALVFVNRRGYAPTLFCHHCGWVGECQDCDSHLTLHIQERGLHCHTCEKQFAVPRSCPHCQSRELLTRGLGSEQTEATLETRFPDHTIIRVDRDSTRQKNALKDKLDIANQGGPCILVGTQMLAKGHHLEQLTLVIIIDADQGFLSPDFRGPERMAQLIVQVAGRAGRADKPGKVLLQSHTPENPNLQYLLDKGYHRFARQLLSERKINHQPPYSQVGYILAESPDQAQTTAFLQNLAQQLHSLPTNTGNIIGPVPALQEKVQNRFRQQLMIQCNNRHQRKQQLDAAIKIINGIKTERHLRWSIIVDPSEG